MEREDVMVKDEKNRCWKIGERMCKRGNKQLN